MPIVIERKLCGVTMFKDERHDDFSLRLKARHNCKRCLGRGKREFSRPNGEEWTELCECRFKK
jgi:hypothetical protein